MSAHRPLPIEDTPIEAGLSASSRRDRILAQLESMANPDNVAGMARYGINTAAAYGVPMPILRKMAREEGRDHELAICLWDSGIHEARIMASLVDQAKHVTEGQAESWASQIDSWDVCDQLCSNLLSRTPFAHRKALEWAERDEEFVKRAGFVLMAALSVHDKKATDESFLQFLPLMERASGDGRNFVRKAVNWALRQVGKRNSHLNGEAIATARRILQTGSRSGRWIASNALRELESEAVRTRIGQR